MLQVTLPDELGEWVAKNAAQEGFGSAEALVVEAVRALRERKEAQREREAKLLMEALESGDPIAPDDQWWDDLQAECLSKIKARGQNGSS